MKLDKALNDYFGFSSFKQGQKEVVTSILEGHDTLAMLPTGTGKSLCYQLAGYLMDGTVLIVSPLLSLMQDQVEQMKSLGEKRVVALNSFQSSDEKRLTLKHLREYKFIFISPEMLQLESVLFRLKKIQLSLFVVDEAHCISQWGYDFRPDYSKLGEMRKELNNPLTLALTATATKDVRVDIIRSLRMEEVKEVIYSVDRPNISLFIEKIENHLEKRNRMAELIRKLEKPGIVYYSSKKGAEDAAEFLKSLGLGRVSAYHGGMDQEQRILVQQQFIYGQLDIICATSAFGMGINKEDIRFVIHFHMPMQLESYLQEIGRAGRDGKPSAAILLYSQGDEYLPTQLAEGEIPSVLQLDRLSLLISEKGGQNFESLSEEIEIKAMCGFSDVQWRFVRDYLVNRMEDTDFETKIHHLSQFTEARLAAKKAGISQMLKWIHAKVCRRRLIMEHFNEDLNETHSPCCDICDRDCLAAFLVEKEVPGRYIRENWKEYLAKILLTREQTT